MSWRGDKTLKVRAHYKGFEILSRGGHFDDSIPDQYVRGKKTYKANLNPDSPSGTIASIDGALRNFDRRMDSIWTNTRRRL
jgi:hypothetical protein